MKIILEIHSDDSIEGITNVINRLSEIKGFAMEQAEIIFREVGD